MIPKFLKFLTRPREERRKLTTPSESAYYVQPTGPPNRRCCMQLPEDVLRLIFESVAKPHPTARFSRRRLQAEAALRLSALRNLPLVCKIWCSVANPLLYAQCVITSPTSLKLLWSTMKSSPKVMKSFTYAPLWPNNKSAGTNSDFIFKICQLLPRDTSTDITVFAAINTPLSRREFVTIVDSLTCLHVCATRNYWSLVDGSVFCKPVLLPKLGCLVLESFIFGDKFDWPSMPMLEQLSFHGCQFTGEDDTLLMSALTSIKRLKLRHVVIYQSPTTARALLGLFKSCASTLEHLSLVGRIEDKTSPVLSWVHLLGELRSFSYGYEISESIYSQDPLEEVDEIFCVEMIPGVPHRSCVPALSGNLVNHSLQFFLDRYVPSMNVKAIRLFGFRGWFGESADLKRRCDEMGIELDSSGCIESKEYIIFSSKQ